MTATDAPRTKARTKDPATSKEAGKKQTRSRSQVVRDHLLRLLKLYGPATDDELAERYEENRKTAGALYPAVSPSGLRSRRNELRIEGLVANSGETRDSALGSPAIVWKAA